MKKLWVLCLCFYAMSVHATDTLFIGFQDYNRSPIQAVEDSRGFTAYLSRVLGMPVKVETIREHDKLIAEAKQKRFGLMFAPASMVMEARAVAGYEPIVKVPGQLAAAFAAPSSSGIAFPEDMKGKRIGFTDKNSMITLLAMAKLREMKINPATYFKSVNYYDDIDGVYTAFKYHLIDIGVANSVVYSTWNNSGGMNLNLIMQSQGAPHLTFAVRGDFPAALKERITQALLNADKDPNAMQSFRGAGFPNFELVDMAQYTAMMAYIATK
ncbi:MAG: PhnD/SsuA/transferrin family substrate-binding protein [Sulfuriferula sp.]|nr:PhnD/SsuA/transferrin family substrate-binding protein [Sulfuriferula sp.]